MGSDMTELQAVNQNVLFQSTLPHGERQKDADALKKLSEFQSTLPHGERPRTISG